MIYNLLRRLFLGGLLVVLVVGVVGIIILVGFVLVKIM